MQVLIDLDQQDVKSGRMEIIHQRLPTAYCQFEWIYGRSRMKTKYLSDDEDTQRHTKELKTGLSSRMFFLIIYTLIYVMLQIIFFNLIRTKG